jgi:hypothetical protein
VSAALATQTTPQHTSFGTPEPAGAWASDWNGTPERPAFVIGDLHGHLDRFEALLKQEGLLDRCPDCDGSGLVGGDSVNGWNCELCEGDGWCRTDKDADVVLVGDVGHFGRDGSPTGDLLTWIAAIRWADVILWGNHDRALVDAGHAFGGYMYPGPEVYHWIARARAEGKLKLAHYSYGFVITHAGLPMAFKNQRVPGHLKEDGEAFVDWINQGEHPDFLPDDRDLGQNIFAVRDAIGARRGGRSNVGGILWRDIDEGLYDGFRQVFGHSADHKEHKVRYCHRGIHTRHIDQLKGEARFAPSYCVDIGGKGDKPGDNCLAGIWLPNERIAVVDMSTNL